MAVAHLAAEYTVAKAAQLWAPCNICWERLATVTFGCAHAPTQCEVCSDKIARLDHKADPWYCTGCFGPRPSRAVFPVAARYASAHWFLSCHGEGDSKPQPSGAQMSANVVTGRW